MFGCGVLILGHCGVRVKVYKLLVSQSISIKLIWVSCKIFVNLVGLKNKILLYFLLQIICNRVEYDRLH